MTAEDRENYLAGQSFKSWLPTVNFFEINDHVNKAYQDNNAD